MKIGLVYTYGLAFELHALGVVSCQDAETKGAMITTDQEARDSVDFWLQMLRQKGGDL